MSPMPELEGLDIDGREIGPSIFAIGNLRWQDDPGQWVCLADYRGALCLVSVKVTPDRETP